MLIQYTSKTIYGKQYHYPASKDAETLCRLMRCPTLTIRHLSICKDSGWRVKEKKDTTPKAGIQI